MYVFEHARCFYNNNLIRITTSKFIRPIVKLKEKNHVLKTKILYNFSYMVGN